MSTLRIQPFVMPAAPLGPENPLTPLRPFETASAAGAHASDADYPDKGNEGSILPYKLQDQYNRNKAPRAFKTAVLENEFLRATFLLEMGGRLWSLVHKPTNRELLNVNPVFQPANLAIRDAWFSGGVEWNISIIGHCPFTCAPLFAAKVLADDGTPVLRMYEFERVRRVPFQIDCWLAPGSPFLMVRVKIINPHDYTIPMYWWSNIAVDEREDVRVIGPAEKAWRHDYDGTLVGHDVPYYENTDVTYTTNRRSAADLYFRIPEGRRPWIAALDGQGSGLIHTSTDRLRGRKMFNWGMDPGGRRWQEFLSAPNQAYIEIQGGLAETQGEYVAMPANTEWSWLEAYGLLEVNPTNAHSKDWSIAYKSVEQELERRLARKAMDTELARSAAMANRAPVELLHFGSGWGALERTRRQLAGEKLLASDALPFPDATISEEQMPWLALLEQGALPHRPAAMDPGSLMVQPEWRDKLEQSARGKDADWVTWYHLGVARYRTNDYAGAREAWEQSLKREESAWSYRDLAVLSHEQGNEQAAIDYWIKAARIAPHLVPLAIEATRMLLNAKRPKELVEFTESLPAEVKAHGRIRLMRAFAALALGDFPMVEKYFQGDVDIANIREKETLLSDLWFGYHAHKVSKERNVPITDEIKREVQRTFPPPKRFDFRIKQDVDYEGVI